MDREQERRWEYDAVEIGQASVPTTTNITEESIAEYATKVRNYNSAYHTPGASSAGGVVLAMPTMLLRAAPLRRGDIASNNGFVAMEHARENPRQTPFAKCEIRWFAPVRAGDSITNTSWVLDKYERRGNKFVTFRVEVSNQHGEKVAEYDYTCIFEYASGQKGREDST